MMFADLLSESNIIPISDVINKTAMTDELIQLPKSVPMDNKSNSITTIKIPLVSLKPILATSPKYILVNEFTKKRNQLILFDDHLRKSIAHSTIRKSILDALWYDNQQCFLLLTSTNVFAFDPITGRTEVLRDLIPIENKLFKCFALLNQSILFIPYDEWGPQYIDAWQYDNETNLWKFIEKQPVKLTSNEFIGNMLANVENGCLNLVITIYNNLTEQWRTEVRNRETMICVKATLLPRSNLMNDYRIISIKNTQSGIKWLGYSSIDSDIIVMDSNWKITQLNYKHPVLRMASFKENYLIVRTRERIDIHSFL